MATVALEAVPAMAASAVDHREDSSTIERDEMDFARNKLVIL